MRMCVTEKLEPGMRLARSIYDERSVLLLGEGAEVTDATIRKLQSMYYPYVYIIEDGTEDIFLKDAVSDQVRINASAALYRLRSTIQNAMARYGRNLEAINTALDDEGIFKKTVLPTDMKTWLGKLIEDIVGNDRNVLESLPMRSIATCPYSHAIDVAALSTMIAKRYGFNEEELGYLALGALLHDIGKAIVPELDARPIKELDEEEKAILNLHPGLGYRILEQMHGVEPIEAHVAYQHHERQDGYGYPRGLKGENAKPVRTIERRENTILRFAEIVAVADAYDNRVSESPHSKMMSSKEAVKELILNAGTELNKDIVQTALRIVPIYPIGVLLKVLNASDPSTIGLTGVVAAFHEEHKDRPTFILLFDQEGNRMHPRRIDFAEDPRCSFEVVL